jgi:hypothetical protein
MIEDWQLLNESKLTDGGAKNRGATRLGDGTGANGARAWGSGSTPEPMGLRVGITEIQIKRRFNKINVGSGRCTRRCTRRSRTGIQSGIQDGCRGLKINGIWRNRRTGIRDGIQSGGIQNGIQLDDGIQVGIQDDGIQDGIQADGNQNRIQGNGIQNGIQNGGRGPKINGIWRNRRMGIRDGIQSGGGLGGGRFDWRIDRGAGGADNDGRILVEFDGGDCRGLDGDVCRDHPRFEFDACIGQLLLQLI